MQLEPAARFKVTNSGVYHWAFIKLGPVGRDKNGVKFNVDCHFADYTPQVDISCSRYWGGPLWERLEGEFLSTCHLLASHIPVSKGETDDR